MKLKMLLPISMLTFAGLNAHAAPPVKPATSTFPPSASVAGCRGYPGPAAVETEVLDLSGNNCDSVNRQIVLTSPARIMATAQVQVLNQVGTRSYGTCRLLISNSSGFNNGMTPMSYHYSRFDMPAFDVATGGRFTNIPVTGSALVTAGTYNVSLRCQSGDFQANVEAGHLLVWVGAQ